MDKKWFKIFEIIALTAIIILVVIYMSLDKKVAVTNNIASIITENSDKYFYGIIKNKDNNTIVVVPDYNSDFSKKTNSIKINITNSNAINQDDRVKVQYKENKNDFQKIIVTKIDKITNDELLKEKNFKMTSLEKLEMDYSLEQAQTDGCYIYVENKEYNPNVLTDFVNNIKDNKKAYIRILQKTIENKIIILDVEYVNNVFLVSIDTRRDDSRIESERKIYNYTYEKINSYDDLVGTHLYLYNGDIQVTKDNFHELDCLLLGCRTNTELIK